MKRGMARAAFAAAAMLLVPALPGRADAQQWSLEAQAGRLRYGTGPAAAASSSLILGLNRDAADSWFGLSTGVPLRDGDPLWGAAGAWKRLSTGLGPLEAGVDLLGHGFVHRQRQSVTTEPGGLFGMLPGFGDASGEEHSTGVGVGGQAMPLLALEHGGVRLQARSGLSHFYSAVGGASGSRTVRVSDLGLTLSPSRSFAVSTEVRRFGAEEGDYTYGGVSGSVRHPLGTTWASVGRWFTPGVEETTPWAAGTTVDLGERVALTLSARRDGFDPVYGSAPRTSWGAGVRVGLGGPPAGPEPVPAVYEGGRATILLPAAAAEGQPRIAGDFNDWTPQPMTRAGKDWSYTVALEPGVYNYAFVAEDGEWFVPESVPGRKSDGMGGHVAVLVVR